MSKNIVKAAGLLLLINVCVKLFGFIREMVIADGFGASSATDAYLVAYTIPYFLQTILGYAFVSAILPLFGRYWREEGDNEEAFRLGSTLINLVSIVMLVLSVVGILAASTLVWLTAPHLSVETAALATKLTQIIFPSLLFMSVGMVISGILNSRYHFAAVAVAPGIVSLGIIVATLFFAHGNIYVVAVGTLIGFAGFFLIQVLDLPKTGFRYRFVCDVRHPAVRRVLKDIVPIVLGLAVTQIYTIINRIFASGLTEGSISALNYANKLMNLPLGLFVMAVTTAVFPALADLARKNRLEDLGRTVSRGLSMILLLAVPSSLGLMLMDRQIVSLLFESGSFGAGETAITASALFAMCPGLVFLAISMLLIRVCYAVDDVRTPLITGAISIFVNVAASFLLVGPFTHTGLAWANSIAAAVNALLMAVILARKLPFLDRYLGRNLAVTGASCLCMAVVVLLLAALLPAPADKFSLLLMMLIVVAAAVLVYFLLLKLLRAEALGDIVREWKRKES